VPDLRIAIQEAHVAPYAVMPMLAFRMMVENQPESERIHGLALRVQIQIDAPWRTYGSSERETLAELFGTPERWSQTLRSVLWTHVTDMVPAFTGSIPVNLQVPCSFDFNVAATKYFHGVTEGEIPLLFLFSGSIFYARPDGALQVAPIPLHTEARFSLPVGTWRRLMEAYYPQSNWLSINRDVFERLYAFKRQHDLPTWDSAIEHALTLCELEVKP
jgi:hypothetical protein